MGRVSLVCWRASMMPSSLPRYGRSLVASLETVLAPLKWGQKQADERRAALVKMQADYRASVIHDGIWSAGLHTPHAAVVDYPGVRDDRHPQDRNRSRSRAL